MIIAHKETQEVEVVDDVICNRCGKSCRNADGFIEMAPLRVRWGYGSSKDTEDHESHLCEQCYDEIVSGFKISPKVTEYLLW